MKKKECYEIIIRSVSGITTTMFRKTWTGAVRAVTRLESTCPNIWADAFSISIISVVGESRSMCNIINLLKED